MTPFDFHVLALRPTRFALTGAIRHCLPLGKLAICLGIIFLSPLCALAQQPAKKSKFEVETAWSGIQFQFVKIERILDERLLVVVRIVATAQAPATGTLIGVKPLVPPGATLEDLRSGRYEPRPFSLASSVMIDDLTSQRFPALAPIFPPGKEYAPAEILAYLSPGRAEVMTLQFKVPPAALRADGPASEKQTVSLLLTNAKAPITAIPIPSVDTKEFSVQ